MVNYICIIMYIYIYICIYIYNMNIYIYTYVQGESWHYLGLEELPFVFLLFYIQQVWRLPNMFEASVLRRNVLRP